MADKEDKGSGGGALDHIELFIALVAIVIFAGYAGQRVRVLLSGDAFGDISQQIFVEYVRSRLPLIIFISFTVSVLCIVGIIYCLSQLAKINKEQKARVYAEEKTSESEVVNHKWERVVEHVESDNENDWRLAILEADIILDELLDKMGYRGDTIGDKLKSVEKSDFTTIDNAWEAHKIRNAIAHEGSEFLLNQREARRVIELYRSVFKEFYYI